MDPYFFFWKYNPCLPGQGCGSLSWPGGGGTFTKIVRGCACRTSKIWLSLYQFFALFPTHQYTIFERKAPNLTKLGGFYNNLPQIHSIYVIWAPSSVMKTPRSLYQILRKSAPKGRHIHVYHVKVRTTPGNLAPMHSRTHYPYTNPSQYLHLHKDPPGSPHYN